MASYGYTSPDSLPYPNVTSEAANVPPSLKAMADASQLALNKRVSASRRIIAGNGLTITNSGVLNADVTMDVAVGTGLVVAADSVDVNYATLNTHYSVPGHTHTPRQVGLDFLHYGPYSVKADDELVVSKTKLAGQNPMATVQHSSAYIFVVISALASTTYSFKIRNSTQSTDHTGIYVNILLVTDS